MRDQLLVLLHLSGSFGYNAVRAAANADFVPNDGFEINFAVDIWNEQVTVGFKDAGINDLVASIEAAFGLAILRCVQVQVNAVLFDGFPREETFNFFAPMQTSYSDQAQ